MGLDFEYTPDGRVLTDFMADSHFVRGLMGHIGSGKSVACVVEMFRLALAQKPGKDGRRRVRSGVIRNTSPQLETTTMKTWLEWLPEDQFGPVRWRPPFRQQIFIPEINLEWEIWFLALDRPEDVKKLLSFEFTNIWLNEARELPYEIITAAISRVGRFPRIIDGGPTRPCVIMDTNAPDEEHWWAIMAGYVEPPEWMNEEDRVMMIKPDNWAFFAQPPAVLDRLHADGTLAGYDLNPDRENAKFTTDDYYSNIMRGQTRDWIKNMLQNKIGRIFSGRPVYQGFNEVLHVVKGGIEADPNEPLYVGVDFGLTPAAAMGQDIRGQVRVIDELVTKDTHTEQFAIMLAAHLNEHYPNHRIVMVGDPRGDDRQPNQQEATLTAFRIFKKHGLDIQPAWSNDPLIRIGAVQTQINTLVDGRPGYVISDKCTYLLNGKKGGYCYLKDGDTIDKKSIYSHVADGEQYMLLKMGYGKKLIRGGESGHRSMQANHRQNVLSSRGFAQSRKQRRVSQILSRGRS